MHFDGGNTDRRQSVAQANRGMSQTSGVDDNTVVLARSLMNPVDNIAFMIRLKRSNRKPQTPSFLQDQFVEFQKRLLTINMRLPPAQHIQIRPVNDQYCRLHK